MLARLAAVLLLLTFASESLADGTDCYQVLDMERRIRGCTEMIAKEPTDAEHWVRRGQAYERIGDRDKALADYDRAVAIDAKSAAAHLGRGDVLSDKGKHADAIAAYTRAIAIEAENWRPLHARARAHLAAGSAREGLQDAERAVALSWRHPEALAVRATILAALDRRDSAILDLRRALSMDREWSDDLPDRTLRSLGLDRQALHAWHGPGASASKCDAETNALRAAAERIELRLNIPPQLVSGGAFAVTWKSAARFDGTTPVFIIATVSDDVRVNAAPLPPGKAKPKAGSESEGVGEQAPDLPGIVLPRGARAPLGIAYGIDGSRVFTPLHQRASKRAGRYEVRLFQAGRTAVEVAVVARTSCGERLLGKVVRREVTISPDRPEIVVQDQYDTDTPRKVIVSHSGRYRAHVFDGRYRVFEVATGAKLLDRAGHDPNFSPTERFVVGELGRSDGRDFEVIDLVSRQVVANPKGPFVGWAHDDAYLIDGQYRSGVLSIAPTLVSRVGANENQRLTFFHEGSCSACPSWAHSPLVIDLDNGILALVATQPDLYELATGTKVCCKDRNDFAASMLRYEISPLAVGSDGWTSRSPIRFSHVFDPAASYNSWAADQDWQPVVRSLVKQRLAHRAAPLIDRPATAPAVGQQLAALQVGDWRGSVSPRRRGTAAVGDGGGDLLAYGIALARPTDGEAVPFENFGGEGKWGDGISEERRTEIEAMIEARTKPLIARIVQDVPVAAKHLAKVGAGESFPEGAEFANGKIDLDEVMLGAWRWQAGGRPVWLLQLHNHLNNGPVGNGAFILGRGGENGIGELLDISLPLSKFHENEGGRVIARVFAGRYLTLGSATARSLAVYDLERLAVVGIVKDIAQAELIEDVHLTADARRVLQINSDGQLLLHDLTTGRHLVGGRTVDGETILYTPEGYYWSSYEGAHFVQLRFPGLPGHYAFHQFAAVLDRPDIVRRRLAGDRTALSKPEIAPPPALESRLEGDGLAVDVRSSVGLAKLRLHLDGRLVSELPISGSAYTGRVAVPRSTHARWLTATAVDRRGFVSAPRAIAIAPSTERKNHLHAIVVGIDTYEHLRDAQGRRVDLRLAVKDATRMAGVLASSAMRNYYGAGNSVRTLTDRDATAAAVIGALEGVVARATSDDTIVLHFSGHGLAGSNGEFFLALSSTTAADLAGTAIAWSRIADVLKSSKARVVVFLDACHSGLTAGASGATNDDAVAALVSGARAPLLVFAASKGRQNAYEAERLGGGVFTWALSQLLEADRQSFDLNGNGVIEVSELYKGLRSAVGQETAKAGWDQSPWLVRQDLVGDFTLF
jgi:hypothetical protein